MIYKARYGEGVISLPERAGELLREMSAGEMRLLIYILSPCRAGRDISDKSAAEDLKMDENEVRSALNYLVSTGLITASGERPPVQIKEETASTGRKVVTVTGSEIPHYTGQEIEKLFEREPRLGDYIGECQRILGRMFTPHEINKLLALREFYGLDIEYVMILCDYCKSRSKGTVPYVEKVAKNMMDSEITTVAALEERINFMKKYDSVEDFIRRLLGVGARAMTQKEKKFIEKWTELDMPQDVIELAYEIAVNNTGAPSMPYMNRVLLNWNDAGYRTGAKVLEGIEEYRKKKESAPPASGSFSTDEFFEAALRRSLNKHTSES